MTLRVRLVRRAAWSVQVLGPTLGDLVYHAGGRVVRVEDLAGVLTVRFGRWGPREVRSALGTLKSRGVRLE